MMSLVNGCQKNDVHDWTFESYAIDDELQVCRSIHLPLARRQCVEKRNQSTRRNLRSSHLTSSEGVVVKVDALGDTSSSEEEDQGSSVTTADTKDVMSSGISIPKPINLCHVIILHTIVEPGISAVVKTLAACAVNRGGQVQTWTVTERVIYGKEPRESVYSQGSGRGRSRWQTAESIADEI